MKKNLSRILAAFLVLCMLPATFITAFARGKGVFGDSTENQSLNNAPGQYIPETITVDGKLNDTGWPESNFNYVDINTGYATPEKQSDASEEFDYKPSEALTALSYKYQIRADHSQFYLGASVDLPEGVAGATFTLLLKDSEETSVGGYTHRLVVALENKTATVKVTENIALSISSDTRTVLAAEKHLIACESDGQNYTFELRNLLEDMGISDISKITYYVSVDITKDGKTESLYHPKYELEYGIKTPTFDYWPVDSDGKVGGQAVDTTYASESDDLPYEVTVDGKFDEAVWASLTDFHLNGKEDPYGSKNDPEIANLDSSKYFANAVTYELKADHTATHHHVYNTSDGVDSIRFKYEIRVDGSYLYGAVVAYVPEFASYTGTYYTNSDANSRGISQGTYTVFPTPDLYVYFFAEDTDNDQASIDKYRTENQVDAVLQVRSDVTTSANHSDINKIAYALSEMKVYEDTTTNETRMTGWNKITDPNIQASRRSYSGNMWNFEFKIPLDKVPRDTEGNITYAVGLGDRTHFSAQQSSGAHMVVDEAYKNVNTTRSFAWTGYTDPNNIAADTHSNTVFYNYNAQVNAGNVITEEAINAASSLTVVNDKMFDDNTLSQEMWAALTAADYFVDSNARGTVDYQNYAEKISKDINDIQRAYGALDFSDGGRFMYKLTADYEYLYGAAYVKLYNGMRYNADSTNLSGTETRSFRLWLNMDEGDTHDGYINIPLDPNGTASGSAGLSNARIDSVVKEVEINNQYYYIIEFRVPASDINISYRLDASEDDTLFTYYTSICTITTDTSKGFNTYEFEMVHPKASNVGTGYYDFSFYPASKWQTDGDAHFTYGNMLDDIKVDGQLDENYWIGDEKETVEMIHVDGTNGTYQNESKQGNSLSFDYKLYAGENYIYGAAIIDETAIANTKAYGEFDTNPITRFDIWIDNKQNEYEWDADNIAGNEDGMRMAKAQDKTRCFENYYYNIYLCTDTSQVLPISSCGIPVCGGSTPNWYWSQDITDDKTTTDDESRILIDTNNYRWAMTTINGKTYVEFMIDLDNFHCDRSLGFNYYVSATHYYENEQTEAVDGEHLTLFYPEIKTETYDFWVTHYKTTNSNADGANQAGIIIDNSSLVNDMFTKSVYSTRVIFELVSNNKYKIVEIWKNGTSCTSASIGINQIAYMIHNGDGPGGTDEADIAAQTATFSLLAKAEVNDEFVFTEINLADLTNQLGDQIKTGSDGNALASGELLAHAWFEIPAITIEAEDGTTYTEIKLENLKYDDDDYRCFYSITPVEELAIDSTTYFENMPDSNVWDGANDGTIKKLTHFAPDVVKVDGDLTESVWGNEDGWIEVQDDINGTFQEADVEEKGRAYRFKLVNDGEYLYVAAEIDAPYTDSFAPSFRIWIQSDKAEKTGEGSEIVSYTNFYRVTYGNSNVNESTKVIEAMPEVSYDKTAGFEYTGYRDGIKVIDNGEDGAVIYENLLVFGKNLSNSVPKGSAAEYLKNDFKYGETALYGYTEEIQENQDDTGAYYPDIEATKTYIGKESAMMKPSTDGEKTWVEFKVALSEFGGVTVDSNGNKRYNDFEYFAQATWHIDGEQNTVFYPLIYTESRSDASYYNNNFPVWKWFGNNAAVVTAEDMQSGAIRMRNNCMPVVTLGAKISEEYVAPDAPNETCKAIRFGALYTEDYLRNWRKTDAKLVSSDDPNYNDMYTAETNDYWDIHEVGIAVLPTQLLEDENGEVVPLKMETEYVFTAPADNIVNWQCGSNVGGWSNFADYENFVFYITLWGIDGSEDMKFSFVPYVDFYASAGTETYYGETFVRSYNMIKDYAVSENGTEDDSSTPVLPDSSETPPPAENHPQESSIAFPSTSEENGN